MDYLVRRPIAVIMAFLAVVIVGAVMYSALPVSLLPDIAIPQITVQVSDGNRSGREIDDEILAPVRRQLMQVGGMEELKSEARDGVGIISMRFSFGTNADYAYIEVNEKIDAAMNSMPSGTARPKAVKASAADVPVFYINVSAKDNTDFNAVCDAVENVIRRRIEQLPEVAIADVTGIPKRCVIITPDHNKMKVYGVTTEDIEVALKANNVSAGSMRVKDKGYEYTVKVSSNLSSSSDIERVYLRCGDRLVQIGDLCHVELTTQQETGLSLADGKRVVSIAVIKRGNEGMEALKEHIGEVVLQLRCQFPELDFQICRDQTELLDYTISNLKQNLLYGLALILVCAILFMGGVRISVIIGISMGVSLVMTFVPFYVFGRSLNIVSLSGLILVIGMMIDNALVVSENIQQWRQRGRTLRVACVGGTKELMTPLLSSSLTTVSVFAPLVFVDGIAGALFGDQAFALSAGLAVSYVVGIVLLPVVFRQLMAKQAVKRISNRIQKPSDGASQRMLLLYDAAYGFVVRHRVAVLTLAALSLPMCWYIVSQLPKEKMPQIDHTELTARVEWNDETSVRENRRRTEELMGATAGSSLLQTAYVGVQDYVLDASNDLSQTEVELYWQTSHADSVAHLEKKVRDWLSANYPQASVAFSPPATVLEKLFTTSEQDIVAELSVHGAPLSADEIRDVERRVREAAKGTPSSVLAFKTAKSLIINRQALELYGVPVTKVMKTLETAISGSQVTTLHSYSEYLPVSIAGRSGDVERLIATESVGDVPIRELVRLTDGEELKTITAGVGGEYIPICFYDVADGDRLCCDIRTALKDDKRLDVDFSGAFHGNRRIMQQLAVVLCISLILMYFIMCAQFESFVLPLIVLVEIPIDAAFGLLVLWLTGGSLNLMSGIGIIVSCGIVVNDSILKIDTINELRRTGMHVEEAVHVAGRRRLRAIVMTSVTTIGAVVPVLFSSDMGSELQRPLAVTMIATMLIGTLVSLFVIPLLYILLNRKRS